MGASRRSQVLLLALLLRGALILVAWLRAGGAAEPFLAPDSASYLETAASLASSAQFSRGSTPEIVRTPGYPALLAPGTWLGMPVVWALLVQLAAGLLTVAVLFDLTRHLSGNQAALRSAALLAVEPLQVIYGAKVLSETVFATLLVLGVWGGIRGWQDRRALWWVGAASIGAAALVRPVGYGLVWGLALLAVAGLFQALRHRGTGGRLPAAYWAGSILLLLSPSLLWQARNLAVADYRGLAAITDINLYFYQAAAVTARLEGRSFYAVQEELGYHDVRVFRARRPDLAPLDQATRLHRLAAEGRHLLRQHPWTYLEIHLRGMVRVLLDPGGVEFLRLLRLYPSRGGLLGRLVDDGIGPTLSRLLSERPGLLFVEGVAGLFLLGLYVAAVRGARILGQTRPWLVWLLVLGLSALVVAAGGPMSLSRFRHPLMPVLCLLAGIGLQRRRAVTS